MPTNDEILEEIVELANALQVQSMEEGQRRLARQVMALLPDGVGLLRHHSYDAIRDLCQAALKEAEEHDDGEENAD